MNVPAGPAPAAVWKALARRLCQPGRDRIKVFDPETKDYAKTRRISDKLPTLMAAVYLYNQRRTTLLALDFDSKTHGRAQVDADYARALEWLTACGARVVTDRSTNGGRHVLVPLAIGTTASFDEIQPLLRQLQARLPSLDPKPMQNPKEGCISVPGTPCAGGGHRTLDGTLIDAVNALTERSDPTLLPALYASLGTLPHTPTAAASPRIVPTIGSGMHERISEHVRWSKPMPADVTVFLETGVLARKTWASPSEARMSAVLNAVLRGCSYDEIRQRSDPGQPWRGLGDSYRAKHGHNATPQLARDVSKALHYASNVAVKANPPAHRYKNSQSGGAAPSSPQGRWLAHALSWADNEFRGSPLRWSVRDVLQSLAIKSALAGEMRSGTPVVGVGGRSLSLSAGLMPATTVFDVLRRIREMVGSPIVLVRPRVGRDADYYALTTVGPSRITPAPLDRIRVEDVHPAWSVLGRHHRVVYELIVHTGLTKSTDIYSAARLSPRAGQLSLSALATSGLISRQGRAVSVGAVSLDDVAAAHHLDELQAERIARYRRERAAWHAWLALQDQLKGIIPGNGEWREIAVQEPSRADDEDWQAAVLIHGPPARDDEAAAVALVTQLIGARVLADAET